MRDSEKKDDEEKDVACLAPAPPQDNNQHQLTHEENLKNDCVVDTNSHSPNNSHPNINNNNEQSHNNTCVPPSNENNVSAYHSATVPTTINCNHSSSNKDLPPSSTASNNEQGTLLPNTTNNHPQHDGEPYIEILPDCVLVNILPYFSIVEACGTLILVCKRWNNLLSSQQHIWRLWCEHESWYGRISFYAQRNNSNSCYSNNGDLHTQKQQKLDYRERWNRLKQSEKRWKQGQPLAYSVVKNAHDTLVVNMGCHNNSYVVYSADRYGCIKTWNVETSSCTSMIKCGEALKFAQFSDDEVAIVASTEGMQIWDLKSAASVATLSSLQYNSIVLHNTNLLAVSSNSIELWDVATPNRISEWSIEASILCASLYGDLFVTGAHENICVWDIRTQKCERVIKAGAFDIELNASCIVSCHAFEFAQKRNLSKYWYNLLTVRDLRSDCKQEKVVDGGYILYNLEGQKLVAGNDTRKLVDVWDIGGMSGFKTQKPGKLEIEGGTATCITSRVSKLCVATRSGDLYLYDF